MGSSLLLPPALKGSIPIWKTWVPFWVDHTGAFPWILITSHCQRHNRLQYSPRRTGSIYAALHRARKRERLLFSPIYTISRRLPLEGKSELGKHSYDFLFHFTSVFNAPLHFDCLAEFLFFFCLFLNRKEQIILKMQTAIKLLAGTFYCPPPPLRCSSCVWEARLYHHHRRNWWLPFETWSVTAYFNL